MPRYTLAEQDIRRDPETGRYHAAERRQYWIDAPDPEAAIAIYAVRHGLPLSDDTPLFEAHITRLFDRPDRGDRMWVQVWDHEDRRAEEPPTTAHPFY